MGQTSTDVAGLRGCQGAPVALKSSNPVHFKDAHIEVAISVCLIPVVPLGTASEVSIEEVARDTNPKECAGVSLERRKERDILVKEIMGKSTESGLIAICLRSEEVLAMSVLGLKKRYRSVYCSD